MNSEIISIKCEVTKSNVQVLELKRENVVLRDQLELLRQTTKGEIDFIKAKNKVVEESNSRLWIELNKTNKKFEAELCKIKSAFDNEKKLTQMVN